MRDHKAFFKGKKITVMGLGLLGRGVGDVSFLAECDADLVVTDLKTAKELGVSVEMLRRYTNIAYILGSHRMEDFEDRDMILVAPSVPLDSPYLAHAREQGISLHQSAALFALLAETPIIGVTGTRGKSTVTHMIHHALTEVTGEKVLLGGNVRDVSNLQLLKDVQDDSLAVFELDSWQLQGFRWAQISPQIAVFTNFMEDHMNYYQSAGMSRDEAMDAYFADKANIFCNQGEGATLITTPNVFARAQTFMDNAGTILKQDVVLVDESTLPEDFLVPVPGAHNRENAALAFEALKAVGLTEEEALRGLSTFRGVPGRLEYLGDIHGVRVYNDNNATTPQATIAGIRAVAQGKNVVLIAGGSYKSIDPSPLIPALEEYCKNVVLLPGTGTEKLCEKLVGATSRDDTPIDWSIRATLTEAVETGLAKSEPGDVLLFSPAFASFGMFSNEYERNDQFVALIKAYGE
jgi:UDP-N-acetylmuramoylalanine--D-glutamate ligase